MIRDHVTRYFAQFGVRRAHDEIKYRSCGLFWWWEFLEVFGLDADVLLTASLVNRPRDQSISLPSLELSLPMTLWLETRVRGHWP